MTMKIKSNRRLVRQKDAFQNTFKEYAKNIAPIIFSSFLLNKLPHGNPFSFLSGLSKTLSI